MDQLTRCPWCGIDPAYVAYHDEEWGRPVHDDRVLFEFLILEGAQAGLSWITVLRKRENYRQVFHQWNIEKIATMTDDELEIILLDPCVVRNRLKIYSVRKNAKIALEIQKEFGSLDAYFWSSSWSRHREVGSILRSTAKDEIDPEKQQGNPDNDWIASGTRNDEDEKESHLPIINHGEVITDFPTESEISCAISKDLKNRGMSFIGSTIMYAFMQAVGMVDDHIDTCLRKIDRSTPI